MPAFAVSLKKCFVCAVFVVEITSLVASFGGSVVLK